MSSGAVEADKCFFHEDDSGRIIYYSQSELKLDIVYHTESLLCLIFYNTVTDCKNAID